jgi:aminopeptidase N
MAFPLRHALRPIAWALMALLVTAAGARAEAPYSFAATPGKLPKTAVPLHYAIELAPDIEKLTLAGSEVVDIEVTAPTDRLMLNAVNMTITSAAIEGDIGPAASIGVNSRAETVTFVFPRIIPVGRYKLRVAFAANINRFGRGLFIVDYPSDDGRKRMISSQLEPSEARRIFPSWDEPAFKASFQLTVTLPDQLLAVSNMPIVREEPAGAGLKRVAFDATPRMSSYLFVLAAGELERMAVDADGVTVGVVATKGKSANGRFALDEAVGLLKYFNDYFGVKYPLPKLDLIAVPGGFGGAMENWGGITFFESRLLFDPATSAPDARRGIFNILAHEMAHLWFGDLVTTAWWDNIWLNEGFASWMQAKSAEDLHPDWQTWLNSNGAKQAAMAEDSRRTTRPIQRPIANETEASAAFDVITYSKGQAIIRMAESYLGADVFRAGIRAYMERHAYSNATTADLWRALEEASGKPVGSVAAAYTEQAGLPLIIAETRCVGGDQRLTLRQERFTVHDPAAKALAWQVPITYGPLSAAQPDVVLLDGTTEIAAGRCGESFKVNLGDIGYYRVQYDGAMRAALAKSVAAMSQADQVNLLADSWALVEAGRSDATDFFDLMDNLSANVSRAVWDQVIRTLSRIDQLERGRPGRAAFWAYARAKLKPVFERVGWERKAEEPSDRALLRARLIRTLGDFGDEAVVSEAKRRFAAFLANPDSLPADLRDPVTHIVGLNADRATYDTLLALARKTTKTDERVRYYSAAASTGNPEFAKETLQITLTDEVTPSLVGTLVFSVAGSGEHAELAVDFVRANFAALAARQGPQFRNTFFSNLMGNFTDPARAAELAAFAPVHETSGGRIVAARTQERILADADFAARALPAIDAWIGRQNGRP